MKLDSVRRQIDEVIRRSIEAGLSMKQFHPGCSIDGNIAVIGRGVNASIALRNVEYASIYTDIEANDKYHIKLPDGGLLLFQYTFESGELAKHRLCFFPCPKLPTLEEAPEIYADDVIYSDIVQNRIVRFPIRFDYDPKSAVDVRHPHSHLTLGQFDNCRIPVSHPVSPYMFLLFILRNFYSNAYRARQNILNRRTARCSPLRSITEAEVRIPHMVLWSKH